MNYTNIDNAGRKVWLLDPGAIEFGRRDIVNAVKNADPGTVIQLLPGTHMLHGGNPLAAPENININRSLTIEAAVKGKATIFGRCAEPGVPTIFARHTDDGLEMSLMGIVIDCGMIADTYEDQKRDAIRIESAKPGVFTKAMIKDCTLRRAGGGIAVQAHVHAEENEDDELEVDLINCTIEDMFDDRREGSAEREPEATSQGVWHDGGKLHMHNNVIRRIGWVPGSRFYKRSNKSHGLYAVRGRRQVFGNIVEQASHTGLAYRAGFTDSVGNIVRKCALGFEAGHNNSPWLATVYSDGDRVQDGAHLERVDPTGGNLIREVTGGFCIHMADLVSLRNFRAWNVSGLGDWAGLHLRRLRSDDGLHQTRLDIDIPSIDVERWGRKFVVSQGSRDVPGVAELAAALGVA